MSSEIAGQLTRLGKDTIFYGMGSVLQKFIGFFLFPIYTRVLSQEAFGAQDLVFTAVTITSYFVVLGLDAGTARNYYDAETPSDRKKIFSTYLLFEVLFSLPVSIALIFFAKPICELLFHDFGLAPYFRLAMASLPFTLTAGVTLLVLRLTFRSKAFALITAAGVLVQAVASIYLVVTLQMGVMGIFLAGLLASIFRAVLGMGLTYKNFGLSFSKSWLKAMLAFGLPLVPASISLWILNYSNRYFLIRLTTLNDIGLLSVGSRIASIVVFVVTAFRTAWGPFAYSLVKNEKMARKTYSRALTYFLLVTLVAAASLSVFAREVILVLATAIYESSASIVPLLACSAIAWGAVYIVGIGYGIAKKSYHTTIATVLAALVNTRLNFLLIPRWNFLGAATATLLGYLVALLYSFIVSRRYFRVDYESRRIFLLTGAITVVISAGRYIDQSLVVWSIQVLLYKILLYMAFLASLFILGIIRRQEVDRVRGYLVAKVAGVRANPSADL